MTIVTGTALSTLSTMRPVCSSVKFCQAPNSHRNHRKCCQRKRLQKTQRGKESGQWHKAFRVLLKFQQWTLSFGHQVSSAVLFALHLKTPENIDVSPTKRDKHQELYQKQKFVGPSYISHTMPGQKTTALCQHWRLHFYDFYGICCWPKPVTCRGLVCEQDWSSTDKHLLF